MMEVIVRGVVVKMVSRKVDDDVMMRRDER